MPHLARDRAPNSASTCEPIRSASKISVIGGGEIATVQCAISDTRPERFIKPPPAAHLIPRDRGDATVVSGSESTQKPDVVGPSAVVRLTTRSLRLPRLYSSVTCARVAPRGCAKVPGTLLVSSRSATTCTAHVSRSVSSVFIAQVNATTI